MMIQRVSVNGERHWQSIDKKSREDIGAWLDLLRTSSGKEFQTQKKMEYTDTPSVQGMWNSYSNVEPNVAIANFPDVSFGFITINKIWGLI
jgi:hypothetical protein